MRIFSNKFLFKNNKMSEIISKLKESEKKYNELKKEKENIAQNYQDNSIIISKEIKLIKEKYEKDINSLKEKNSNNIHLVLNNHMHFVLELCNNSNYQHMNFFFLLE